MTLPDVARRTASAPPAGPSHDWSRYFPELSDPTVVEAHWQAVLAEGLALPGSPAVETFVAALAAAPVADTADELPFAAFLTAHVQPLVVDFERRIARLRLLADDHGVPDARAATVADIAGNLGIRTMVTELARARAAGLPGDTPELRYAAFRAALPGRAAELVAAYPLLFQLIWHRVAAHLDYLAEVLEQTEQHWPQITATIPGVELGDRVRAVQADAGDSHAGGRTVVVLGLASGRRLVVKPRNLAVDEAYARVLGVVGAAVGCPLPTPATCTRGRLGWVEFVEPPAEGDAPDPAGHLAQVGALLAVLHLLNANDMHFENLLVHPDGSPVVIDLETLLRPRPLVATDQSPMGQALRHIDESVLGTGVLPTILTSRGEQFDVGATGYAPGQLAPTRSYELQHVGRDDMVIAFTRAVVDAPTRNVSIAGSGLPATQVRELLVTGFRRVMGWALGHRDELADLVRVAFGGVPVRYVHQPTLFYGQLLRMLTHPTFLARPEHRHMLAQRVRTRRPEFPATLHESEARQLFHGDIPIFTAPADGEWLLDDLSRPVARLACRPVDDAVRRIRSLTPAGVAEQERLLRLSFVPKLDRDLETTAARWSTEPAPGATRRASQPGRARAVVDRLADELIATMITGAPGSAEPPTWVAPLVTTDESGIWSPGALGYDLYAGVPGIGLFLAAAAVATGRADLADAGRLVLTRHARLLDPATFDLVDVSAGVGQGLGGALTAALHGGLLLRDPDLVAAAWQALPGIARVVPQDQVHDYVTGTAGALAACLAFARTAEPGGERHTLAVELAGTCATHHADWWRARPAGAEIFTGFAHGLSGMAPYLAEYAAVSGDRRAADTARAQLDRLETLRGSDDDWDLGSAVPTRAYAWCHGAPGIALGLAMSAPLLPGAVDPVRLRRAVELTQQHGLGNNVTACHGDLGTLDILAQVAELSGDDRLATHVVATFDRLQDDVLEPHLRRSDSRLCFTTSAFLGTTAIGLALCRRLGVPLPSLLSLR